MKGIVYKIECKITSEVYIGSTTHTIKQRQKGHKSPSNKCASKQIIARGNYEFIILEEIEFEDQNELLYLERQYQKIIPNINFRRSIITDDELKIEKKEYNTQYYLENCEKINENSYQYYLNNSENIKKRTSQYYLDNSEKIKEQSSEKMVCYCGSIFRKSDKSRHLKSQIHISHISNI